MIPTFFIEDLTIDKVDDLVEKGVVFDVTSKTAVLSKNRSNRARDEFWCDGSGGIESLQQTST